MYLSSASGSFPLRLVGGLKRRPCSRSQRGHRLCHAVESGAQATLSSSLKEALKVYDEVFAKFQPPERDAVPSSIPPGCATANWCSAVAGPHDVVKSSAA